MMILRPAATALLRREETCAMRLIQRYLVVGSMRFSGEDFCPALLYPKPTRISPHQGRRSERMNSCVDDSVWLASVHGSSRIIVLL